VKGLISWFAENTVAANLLMVMILAGGFFAMTSLRQEVVPEVETNKVVVSVPYPGATPSEIEEAICVKIEEQVQGLEGVKRITSSSKENLGTVTIEALNGTDMTRLLSDVKSRVDAIDTFPKDAEEPVVKEVELVLEVMSLALTGPTGERDLVRLGERLRDEISNLPGITRVELVGKRPWEISIEVSEEALRKHGLTFEAVANAVRRASLDLPGGTIHAKAGEILVRSLGQGYSGADFEALPLLTLADGSRLLLGEVAKVVDSFAEVDNEVFFDGSKALLIKVFRVGDQSALAIAETTKEWMESAAERLPEGVRLSVWHDDARLLAGRLGLLLRNGRNGFLLVFLCLALFLRLRLAFWVSFGIPLSFLGAVWLMPGLDVTVNMISLFGFIVVLGIIVDDAIVVGENIFTHLQKGVPIREAVKKGAIQVAVPVVFAVLTTIAAFSPMLGLPGTMGQFARNIPLVVVACLVFSLIESLLVLPAHLRHLRQEHEPKGIAKIWYGFQGIFTRGLETFIERVYQPSLHWALEWRYLTLSIGLATVLFFVGLVAAGWLKFNFFPKIDSDNVSVALTMPMGTPKRRTESVIRGIEDKVEILKKEFPGAVKHVLSAIGDQPYLRRQMRITGGDADEYSSSPQIGEVTLELTPSEERSVSSSVLASRWRELVGEIPEAVAVSFNSNMMNSGADLNIQLSAPDFETLRNGAEILKRRLGDYPGVFNLADSFRVGKQEIRVRIRPEAETLGLRQTDLARQLRQAIYGEEAQRVQRGRDDVKVMVRYTTEERQSLSLLDEMRIRTRNGDEVPLSVVAEIETSRELAEIQRSDRQRSVQITAEVDDRIANSNEILADVKAKVLPGLTGNFPGMTWSFEGQQREQRDFVEGMKKQAMLALVLIYILLAIPFRSYVQPMIIMSVIPFGLVGAILGHLLLGFDLTMMSLIGIIALAGVVVNDSLVIVDFVNRARRGGTPLVEAVEQSGASRFRPILLTSLTTFAGLLPMLMERSLQAKFLIPMAVSLGFGIIFATVITLVFVPCFYLVIEDVLGIFRSEAGPPADPEGGVPRDPFRLFPL